MLIFIYFSIPTEWYRSSIAIEDLQTSQSSPACKDNGFSGRHEIPHILHNVKEIVISGSSCPQEPATEITILHQIYPIYVTPSYLFKIHFNAILPTAPTISKQSLSSGFSTKILYAFLIAPMHVMCPAHLILLNLFTPRNYHIY
jgi:hypothetical protein